MAIATNNGPKPNPGEIKQVLNFLKEILPNKYVSAIDLLLHPCCTIIGAVEANCIGDPTTFALTITTDVPILFPGVTEITIVIDGVSFPGTIVNPTTITAQYIAPSPIVAPTELDVLVEVKNIVSYDSATSSTQLGVFRSFVVEDVEFDGTPCN